MSRLGSAIRRLTWRLRPARHHALLYWAGLWSFLCAWIVVASYLAIRLP